MIMRLRVLFICLLVVTSFHFFGATFLNESLNNYISFFFVFVAVVLSAPFVFNKKGEFVFAVRLIALSILTSIFMAYWSWGQGFMYSIVTTVPLLIWVVFFYLIHAKFPVKTLENIVLTYGLIYVILYFYQLTHYQTILFGHGGWGDEFANERGVIRIIFPGGGIFFLAVFIALNKLTTKKSGIWLWLLYSILGLIIPVMQATRQFIAGVVIIYLFHLIKDKNNLKRILILSSFAGLVFYIGHSNIQVIKGLIKVQEETAKEGSNNIRAIAGNYFLTQFSPNNLSRVFGNGVPDATNRSPYSRHVVNLNEQGLYLEDVGIIGLYAMFGIPSVIGYTIIWVKSIFLELPNEYYYVKYYLWFLLITSLTSDTLFHPYYLISTVFALYIYRTIYCKYSFVKQNSHNL